MKTIIATIKPGHLINIRRGVKEFEIRKTTPKEAPFRVLLCESGSGGQIKAEFVCDTVLPVDVTFSGIVKLWDLLRLDRACITHDEMAIYIGQGRTGYAWSITEMVDYCNTKGQRVRHISEYGLKRPPQSWQYVKEE